MPMSALGSIPNVPIYEGFGEGAIDLSSPDYKNKKLIVMGVPGAFTPTWSTQQIPAYLKAENKKLLADRDVDEVIIYSVNDFKCVEAWSKTFPEYELQLKVDSKSTTESGEVDSKPQSVGPLVRLCADPGSKFTQAVASEIGVDLSLSHPGPVGKLGAGRCKRFAIIVDKGTIMALTIAEKPDDPAGDDDPDKVMPWSVNLLC